MELHQIQQPDPAGDLGRIVVYRCSCLRAWALVACICHADNAGAFTFATVPCITVVVGLAGPFPIRRYSVFHRNNIPGRSF